MQRSQDKRFSVAEDEEQEKYPNISLWHLTFALLVEQVTERRTREHFLKTNHRQFFSFAKPNMTPKQLSNKIDEQNTINVKFTPLTKHQKFSASKKISATKYNFHSSNKNYQWLFYGKCSFSSTTNRVLFLTDSLSVSFFFYITFYVSSSDSNKHTFGRLNNVCAIA